MHSIFSKVRRDLNPAAQAMASPLANQICRTLSGYNNSFFREACAIGLGMAGNGCKPVFPPSIGEAPEASPSLPAERITDVKTKPSPTKRDGDQFHYLWAARRCCDCFLRLAS